MNSNWLTGFRDAGIFFFFFSSIESYQYGLGCVFFFFSKVEIQGLTNFTCHVFFFFFVMSIQCVFLMLKAGIFFYFLGVVNGYPRPIDRAA